MTAKEPIETLVARVDKVAAAIAGRAAACEELRMVPPENVALLKETGYTRGLVPRRYGGSEENLAAFNRASRRLAAACPSTGWVMHLLSAHAHVVAAFDRRVQDEVWGSGPDTFVCSSVAPVGRFQRVDGGYRVSGRYRFSSGCDHARWTLVGGLCPNESGGQDHLLAILPQGDYSIIDTWHVAGLRGTGSKDLEITDRFVPEYRVESLMDLAMGKSRGVGTHDGALYRIPFMAVFGAGFATVALGIADGMLGAYRDYLEKRVRVFTGAKVAGSMPACMRLAESTHEVHAAALILEHDWADFVAHGEAGRAPDEDTQVRWRTNQAFAVKLAVRAVDRLYEASGGAATHHSHPAQRYWRDIHTAAAHAYTDYDVAAQILGRHLAGLPRDPTLL